jgi:TolA-binding protein
MRRDVMKHKNNQQSFFNATLSACIFIVGGAILLGGCASMGSGLGETHYAAVADESFMIYKEAERAFKAGDFELSKKNYDDFINRFPDDPLAKVARYFLGRSLEELGNDEAAREAYLRLMELNPDDFWAEYAAKRIQTLK